MSTGTTDAPESADVGADQPAPRLSGLIQRHLGTLLAAAYVQDDAELSARIRFAELLANLDVAFEKPGDRDAAEFKQLLIATLPALRRFAVSLTRESVTADDLVQDALLRAWRSRDRFEQGSNFEAWTFTILRNTFYSIKRKNREVQDEDGSRASRLASLPEQGGRLDLQDLYVALDRLAPTMREALMLVAFEGLSYEEVAAIMSCQIGTVKSRVWRARDQLARALGYTGDEIGNDAVMLSALNGPAEVSE